MPRKRKLPPGLWKRGDTYYARFTHGGRTVRKRLSSDYDVACEALNSLRARADRGNFDLIDNDYKWDDLKADFLKWAKQSVRGHKVYGRDLGHFEKYSRVQSIRQIDQSYVMGYREWRLSQRIWAIADKAPSEQNARHVSPRTVNREVGTLLNMLNKGVAWGKLGSNPILPVKALSHDAKVKQRRALTLEEVEAVFRLAPPSLLPVLRTFATTGIRRSELVELRFTDVDWERRCIVIRASVAKNHKAREIPLDDGTFDMLSKLRDDAPARQQSTDKRAGEFSRDHVFVTGANTPWRCNLLREFYRVCGKAGIDDAGDCGSVDLHSLRVTAASLMIEHGASPKAVQAILGHSTLSLTMGVYAKATEGAKRDAVSALPFARVSAPAHVLSLEQKRTDSRTAKSSAAQVQSA